MIFLGDLNAIQEGKSFECYFLYIKTELHNLKCLKLIQFAGVTVL